MHRDQRNHQTRLRAEFDDHRGHQRRDQDVVGRRRHAHAKHQADKRGEQQHHHHVAARNELDEVSHAQAEPGQRDRADDQAGAAGGDRDADHVACAVVAAVDDFTEPALEFDAEALSCP